MADVKGPESTTEKYTELFQGFSKLGREERLQRLVEMGALSADDVRVLRSSAVLPIDLAEKFIENALG
jgi:hydroxymethylglutaryl-CoA reductase